MADSIECTLDVKRRNIVGVDKINDVCYLFFLCLYFCVSVIVVPEVLRWLSIGLVFLFWLPKMRGMKIQLTGYTKWVSAFLLISLASVIWALKWNVAMWVIVQMFSIWIITFSIFSYVKTADQLRDIFKIYFIANVFFLVYVLFYFDMSSMGEERLSDSEGGLNGNSIAASFVFAIYSGFFVIKAKRTALFSKMLFYGIAFLMFVILLYTGSRTALFLLLFPVCFYSFLNSKNKIKALLGIILILIFALLIVMSIPSVYNVLGVRVVEMFGILNGEAKGDVSRLLLISLGIEWFKEAPWLGIGINNFRVLSDVTPPFVGKNFYAHSNLMELLVDIGVIGTLIYYSGFFYLIRKALKQAAIYSKIIITIATTLLIHDIVSMSYYEFCPQLIICIGFIMLNINSHSETNLINSVKNGK